VAIDLLTVSAPAPLVTSMARVAHHLANKQQPSLASEMPPPDPEALRLAAEEKLRTEAEAVMCAASGDPLKAAEVEPEPEEVLDGPTFVDSFCGANHRAPNRFLVRATACAL